MAPPATSRPGATAASRWNRTCDAWPRPPGAATRPTPTWRRATSIAPTTSRSRARASRRSPSAPGSTASTAAWPVARRCASAISRTATTVPATTGRPAGMSAGRCRMSTCSTTWAAASPTAAAGPAGRTVRSSRRCAHAPTPRAPALSAGAQRSVPAVEVRPERLALLAHHAEAVAAGRFHDHPGAHGLDLARAERDQPFDLGIDVVGLDVEVDARRMRDLLQQQDGFVVFGVQARVLAVAILVEGVDALAERLAPEFDVRRQIVGVAIEYEGAQAAVVGHDGSSWVQ